jgi:hypothetical protein
MNERKQSLVVLIATCLLMLVGLPLMWMAVVTGNVIDLSIEAANPARQGQIALVFVYWLGAATTFVLLTAGICAWLGKAKGTETAPAAAPEAAAPRRGERRQTQPVTPPRLPMGGALPKGSG